MDMESKGWVRAKEIIRKRKADMALKADLVEQRLKGQGHVVNNMSEGNRSSNQSPGKQRKKYDNDYRAREMKKGKGRDSSQSRKISRNSSNTRL